MNCDFENIHNVSLIAVLPYFVPSVSWTEMQHNTIGQNTGHVQENVLGQFFKGAENIQFKLVSWVLYKR